MLFLSATGSHVTLSKMNLSGKYFNRCVLSLLMASTAAVTVSCSSEKEGAEDAVMPQMVILFSPGGLGDMSYNDCILEGVQRFKKEHQDIDVYLYSPGTIDEAERIFSDWLKRPESNIPVLFTLASSDYEAMADGYLSTYDLSANKSVLLFETSRQYTRVNIHTFETSMYGAAYLAGTVAVELAGGKGALVMLANDSDEQPRVACDGFMAGYGRACNVECLADDWTGYVSANLAYQMMDTWATDYGFIFPVAGGSNAGLYRYSREFDECPYLAGMDIDQSSLSDKITGSLIKHIDNLVYEYLTEWTQTGTMPDSRFYGLESGYVDWVLSPQFELRFNQIVTDNRHRAIEKEEEYYEAKGD